MEKAFVYEIDLELAAPDGKDVLFGFFEDSYLHFSFTRPETREQYFDADREELYADLNKLAALGGKGTLIIVWEKGYILQYDVGLGADGQPYVNVTPCLLAFDK